MIEPVEICRGLNGLSISAGIHPEISSCEHSRARLAAQVAGFAPAKLNPLPVTAGEPEGVPIMIRFTTEHNGSSADWLLGNDGLQGTDFPAQDDGSLTFFDGNSYLIVVLVISQRHQPDSIG